MTFGVNVALANLFEQPTIAGLAEVVDMLMLTSPGFVSVAGAVQREEFDL